jgi:hypothetical protein
MRYLHFRTKEHSMKVIKAKMFTLTVTFSTGKVKTAKSLLSKEEAMTMLNSFVWPGDEYTFEISEQGSHLPEYNTVKTGERK